MKAAPSGVPSKAAAAWTSSSCLLVQGASGLPKKQRKPDRKPWNGTSSSRKCRQDCLLCNQNWVMGLVPNAESERESGTKF